jgi:hypothetical protein
MVFSICLTVQEFWLDKAGGGTCLTIYSRALSITGIDDRRYWNYIPNDESRYFHQCIICPILDPMTD